MSTTVQQAPTGPEARSVPLHFALGVKGTFLTLLSLGRSVSVLLLAFVFTGRKLLKSCRNKAACPIHKELE